PDLHPLRHVLLVPDVQHEFLPQFFPPGALEERRRLYGDSIRRADHVCAISEFTRRTLIDRLGVPPGKVTAVPLAAAAAFRPSRWPPAPPSARAGSGRTHAGCGSRAWRRGAPPSSRRTRGATRPTAPPSPPCESSATATASGRSWRAAAARARRSPRSNDRW